MRSLGLLICSVLLSLVVAEGLLRFFVSQSVLYSTLHTVPELNEWENALQFWEQYSGDTPADAARSFVGYDSVLGWDFERQGDRIKGNEVIADSAAEGVTRFLAIGDSFTYGLDVAEQENFAEILSMLPDVELLNMSVPGYGIDQAYLKYQHYGARYAPQVIIFGVYVSDYERSSVGFTTFAKPVFKFDGGRIDLLAKVVQEPRAELSRIEQTMRQKIYLVEVLRNLRFKLQSASSQRQVFFNDMDPLITHVFRLLQSSLQANQRLLIIHIPRAQRASSKSMRSPRTCMSICWPSMRHWVWTSSTSPVHSWPTILRENGSVGHFSARGHRKVAELIAAELKL